MLISEKKNPMTKTVMTVLIVLMAHCVCLCAALGSRNTVHVKWLDFSGNLNECFYEGGVRGLDVVVTHCDTL